MDHKDYININTLSHPTPVFMSYQDILLVNKSPVDNSEDIASDEDLALAKDGPSSVNVGKDDNRAGNGSVLTTLDQISVPHEPSHNKPITQLKIYLTLINNYFYNLQKDNPKTALLLKLLRASAIISREFLCHDTVIGRVYQSNLITSSTLQRALTWSGVPLYLASEVLRDPIGDIHRLFFAYEIVFGKYVNFLGTLSPLILLFVPVLYRHYVSPFVLGTTEVAIQKDGEISTYDCTFPTPMDNSAFWPFVGKYFNEYVLMRIPYYRSLLDTATSSPGEATWFGNVLGCVIIIIARDVVLKVIRRRLLAPV